ncbi:exonuclease domain-containing protein [Streptomyces sp. NPDC012746]|uniref:exonuclease domain-containing protein n=1 Tax=Streptomyces sp. NPDC012746 TaxID=3364845 RepID=UPI0036AAF2F2
MDSITVDVAIPAGRLESQPAAPRPLAHVDGIPLYASGRAPDHLRSQTQLAGSRLKPAPGQLPAAYVRTREWGDVALYEPDVAVRMRPLPSSVKKRMAARRTCPTCLAVRPGIVRGRRCSLCAERERAAERRLAARTCRDCETVRERPYPPAHGRCQACRTAQRLRERTRRAEWLARVTTCSGTDCAVRVVSRRTALGWLRRNGAVWYSPSEWPDRCPPCTAAHLAETAAREERYAREAAERAARARENRAAEVTELRRWAADALADPAVVILDTETCGLDADSAVVEIAVITAGGEVLLDTLVNPGQGVSIPAEAAAIHGITDSDVALSSTFSDIAVRLTRVLDGRRILIWNAPYDVGRLRYELTRHYTAMGHADAAASADAWLDCMRFEDAMGPYSTWAGEWSDYFGSYRWQALGGGHRALGDVRTVIERLREMAALPAVSAGATDAVADRVA